MEHLVYWASLGAKSTADGGVLMICSIMLSGQIPRRIDPQTSPAKRGSARVRAISSFGSIEREENEAMAERTLAKTDWQSYCDRISKAVTGKRAQIEIVGLRIGDQIQAESLPLLGITYDPKDDLLEIALEGLDHLINKPRAVSVDDGPEGLISMEIVDSDGQRQIVKLVDALMLPPPRS